MHSEYTIDFLRENNSVTFELNGGPSSLISSPYLFFEIHVDIFDVDEFFLPFKFH